MRLAMIAVALFVATTGEASDTVTLTLPKGDPQAGRQVFVTMGCPSCHAVAGDTEFPDPVSANRGPTLGGYHGEQGPSRLAMSIFSPSHEISATVREREDELSPMGDFSQAMTVRQFLDVVAYVGSLGTPKK